MVKAVLTTNKGEIVQKTFDDLDEFTDHIKENHGLYTAFDAKIVRSVKDIRQGRCDRTVTRP